MANYTPRGGARRPTPPRRPDEAGRPEFGGGDPPERSQRDKERPRAGNQGASGRGANAAVIAAKSKAGLESRRMAQLNTTPVRKSEIKTRPVAKSEVVKRNPTAAKRPARARYP